MVGGVRLRSLPIPVEATIGLQMSEQGYLRRKDAAVYLKSKYGWGSWQTLAKLAVNGDGPVFRKFGCAVLYKREDLDAWAVGRMGEPIRFTQAARILRPNGSQPGEARID